QIRPRACREVLVEPVRCGGIELYSGMESTDLANEAFGELSCGEPQVEWDHGNGRGDRRCLDRKPPTFAQSTAQRLSKRLDEVWLVLKKSHEVIPRQREELPVSRGANRGRPGRSGEQCQLAEGVAPPQDTDDDRLWRLPHHLEAPREQHVQAVAFVACAEQPAAGAQLHRR